jgi:hypothetical protein
LSRRCRENPRDLPAVPFDRDLLTLNRQLVQYPPQVARQAGCCNRLPSLTSYAKYDYIMFCHNPT